MSNHIPTSALTARDINWARALFQLPPSDPVTLPGFPVRCWIVEPLWRVAWLGELSLAAALPLPISHDDTEKYVPQLLGALNITWFSPVLLNGSHEPVLLWPVKSVQTDLLVLWRSI